MTKKVNFKELNLHVLKEIVKKIIIKFSYFVGVLEEIFHQNLDPPVFILGTGRCGTSLLDKILKSHPNITGFPGEANKLWHPKLEGQNKIKSNTMPIEFNPKLYTELSLKDWSPYHLKKLKRTFNGFQSVMGKKKVFFIKSAMISFLMPQIIELFPDAKFIHIYRYGPSVIYSYFKKNHKKYSNYSTNENDYYIACAKYWNSCILNIEQDRQKFFLNKKNKFFELSYESLCDKTEETLKKLSTFLNIELHKFTFDFSEIYNTNYKIGKNHMDIQLKQMINQEINPAMKLKGYEYWT